MGKKIWQMTATAQYLIDLHHLDYPDQDPTVQMRYSLEDLRANQESFFMLDLPEILQIQAPPFIGIVNLDYVKGADCLPTKYDDALYDDYIITILRRFGENAFDKIRVEIIDSKSKIRIENKDQYDSLFVNSLGTGDFSMIIATKYYSTEELDTEYSNGNLYLKSDLPIPKIFGIHGIGLFVLDEVRFDLDKSNAKGIVFKIPSRLK